MDNQHPIPVLFPKITDNHLATWAGYSETNLVIIFLDFCHFMAYMPPIIFLLLRLILGVSRLFNYDDHL